MNVLTTRREFFQQAAGWAGAAAFVSSKGNAGVQLRTASDQVPLGKTGLRVSRLGMGTGSNSGSVQRSIGRDRFHLLVQYAFDQGITFFDTAQRYENHDWIRTATRRLPREQLFLQTKMSDLPEKPAEAIDRYRRELGVDYLDSVLLQCMVQHTWTDDYKRVMDALTEAQERKIIRAKGVSCHSLPALKKAAQSDWPQVNLVRVNPQGMEIDGPIEAGNVSGDDVRPVMEEVKSIHAKGHGVIGMKLIGNGSFLKPEDRERSIRFVMAQPEIDAVIIGFKATQEIDEAINRINRALRESTT